MVQITGRTFQRPTFWDNPASESWVIFTEAFGYCLTMFAVQKVGNGDVLVPPFRILKKAALALAVLRIQKRRLIVPVDGFDFNITLSLALQPVGLQFFQRPTELKKDA